MEQKQVKSLNGFIEYLLFLGVIGCIAYVFLNAMAISEETTTVAAGVYGIIASIAQAFFIIKMMGLHKVGVYGYFALAAIDIVAVFIFADGDFSRSVVLAGIDVSKAVLFFLCLFFLKKNGISGWDAIMKD